MKGKCGNIEATPQYIVARLRNISYSNDCEIDVLNFVAKNWKNYKSRRLFKPAGI